MFTYIYLGLQLAQMTLIQSGRPEVAKKLIVLISDGWYTMGPDPIQVQQAIRSRVSFH